MRWQEAAVEECARAIDELGSRTLGLTQAEADANLARFGVNVLDEHRVSIGKIVARQFHTTFIYLLLAAAALSFFLGQNVEGGMILFFLLLNASLGFFQEYRSARAMHSLKRYWIGRARVRRGQTLRNISFDHVVPGDIVVLRVGDIVPADMRLIAAHEFFVDEQILTGENRSREKTIAPVTVSSHNIGQARNTVFAGTSIVRGSGEGVVLATGRHTVLGDIAGLADQTQQESIFERDVARFSTFILRLTLVTLILIFLAHLAIKGQAADVPGLLVFFLVLVVSVLPEALPFFITVSLSRASLRLARQHVVVKRLSSIEDLGSIEVLCADKTGTLTEKEIAVARVEALDKEECLAGALLVGSAFEGNAPLEHDPFDQALLRRCALPLRRVLEQIQRLFSLPFDPERLRGSVLAARGSGYELWVRGAPEAVLPYCIDLTLAERERLLNQVRREGEAGYRVLAVAKKNLFKPDAYQAELEESALSFIGLIFFTDPIKASAKTALEQARHLGVAVKIITGDEPGVAGAVAGAVGLIRRHDAVLTGEAWDNFSSAEKAEAADRHAVFARISPRQKYEIIEILEKRYEVGFLGEGMNDAPALKRAHVGLAVDGATDIAREASDIVLLDRSLGVVIEGIREGRRTFANMNKYIKMTLASNFGNFYSVALASLLIPFVPMLPVQILLIDILSGAPVMAFAFDRVERTELRRPRSYNVRNTLLLATLLGVVSSVFDFILFAVFHTLGASTLQTAWFLLSLLTEMVIIYAIRTRGWFYQAEPPAKTLVILSIMAAAVGLIIPYTLIGQQIFGFTPLPVSWLLWIGVLVVLYLAATEAVKHFYYRILHAKPVARR